VVDALARRDQARMLLDGMTAANDLGLTDAVPARVVVHTDVRRRSIQVGNLVIEFRLTAPSKLYWAGRPAMRIVQALHWLRADLESDRDRVLERLRGVLRDPAHGPVLRRDLQEGLHTLPAWMQPIVGEFVRGEDRTPAAPDGGHEVADREGAPRTPKRSSRSGSARRQRRRAG
jgi:hypothetical protein